MSEAGGLLPLFPLNTVLFPSMNLPLHVFEPRYRLMIGQCLERRTPFGVVLIKEGEEVGGPAVPFDVGTTARIVDVAREEDGRMNIMTRGERRFRILGVVQTVPYLLGRVEELPEPAGDGVVEVAAQVRKGMEVYVRLLLGLRGGWVRQVELPRDPVLLSYFTAHFLQVEPRTVKQTLLECATARERLELEAPLVAECTRRARAALEQESPLRRRLN